MVEANAEIEASSRIRGEAFLFKNEGKEETPMNAHTSSKICGMMMREMMMCGRCGSPPGRCGA